MKPSITPAVYAVFEVALRFVHCAKFEIFDPYEKENRKQNSK